MKLSILSFFTISRRNLLRVEILLYTRDCVVLVTKSKDLSKQNELYFLIQYKNLGKIVSKIVSTAKSYALEIELKALV